MKKIFTLFLLGLGATTLNAQNLQSGMEDWHTYIADTAMLEAPDDWFGSDSLTYSLASAFFLNPAQQIFRDTHAHSGTYAAKLVSHDIGSLIGVAPAVLSNGPIVVDVTEMTFGYQGGTVVTERISYVDAWIDYQPQNDDVAAIIVQAVLTGQGVGGTDSIVGTGLLTNDGTTGYEQITVPIDYVDADVVPDRILIAFSSSEDLGTGSEGSTLWVDDVTLIEATSVKTTSANTTNVKCYPNPATGIINVSSNGNVPMTMQVFSLSGQIVSTKNFNGRTQTDLSNLNNGMYFYSIRNTSGELIVQDKLVINK